MGPRQVSRNMFGLAFSSGAAAVFLIVTGLMGWEPPANLNLAESGWRRGAWTGGVIWSQVLFGIAFLVMAGFAVRRINRRLSQRL
jgi:hypothetical protein